MAQVVLAESFAVLNGKFRSERRVCGDHVEEGEVSRAPQFTRIDSKRLAELFSEVAFPLVWVQQGILAEYVCPIRHCS